MIKHRPHGIEHPYATSPDQRVPVLPLAGETVRLGVLAPDVETVTCEFVLGNDSVELLPMTRVTQASADAAALLGQQPVSARRPVYRRWAHLANVDPLHHPRRMQ